MSIQIMIGGIRFQFDSDFEIRVEKSLTSFLCIEEETADIKIKMSFSESEAVKPQAQMLGEDLLLEYYCQNDLLLCLAKGSKGKYLSTTIYDDSFSNMECHLHFEPIGSMKSLGNLMRFLPMCDILQRKNVIFFHASQIEINGKGILFTAPSGTGKTTQAKLWKMYRGARIVCNDRTLIQGGKTYGYPVDGSEPICSGECFSLGTVVLLEQGEENQIRLLNPREATLNLFPQLVISMWNAEARILALDQLIQMMKNCPVYLLKCTPQEAAVQCLEKQLIADGVI